MRVRTLRCKILTQTYVRLYGRDNPHFGAFCRAIVRHGGRYLELTRYYSGSRRDRIAEVCLVTADGAVVAFLEPSGKVQIRDVDFRIDQYGIRWLAAS